MPHESGRDIAGEVAYVVEHGDSPEACAARTLWRFMTCKAGTDLVEYGLLRPYGYSLDAGRVVATNRMLDDALEYCEVLIASTAQELHDGTTEPDKAADELARVCEYMRNMRKRAASASR